MKLSSLLTEDQIVLQLQSTEHLAAVRELLDRLISIGKVKLDQRDELSAALCTREQEISTGVGYGVAIPHTFSDKIDDVTAIFGRSESGIDFDSLDQGLVHFIILFIVPRQNYHLHLQTLAAIARMFTKNRIREQLLAAETKQEILQILHDKQPK